MKLIGQSSQCVMQQSDFSDGLSQLLSELQLGCTGSGCCGFQLLLQTSVLKPVSHTHTHTHTHTQRYVITDYIDIC